MQVSLLWGAIHGQKCGECIMLAKNTLIAAAILASCGISECFQFCRRSFTIH